MPSADDLLVVVQVFGRRQHGSHFRQQPVNVPVRGPPVAQRGVHYVAKLRPDHLLYIRFQVGPGEYLVALDVYHVPVRVHHVVVLDQVLPHVEVVGLDLRLRVLYGLVYHPVVYRNVVLQPRPVHERAYPVPAEPPHQVVVQRDVELRLARIALPPGSSAQLVVNPTRLVPLRPDDVKPARLQNLAMVRFPLRLGHSLHLGVSTQHDVRPAPRHVRGDRHRARLARLRHYQRLALVLLRVQHLVRYAVLLEHFAEQFGFVYVRRSHQHRLPRPAPPLYLLHTARYFAPWSLNTKSPESSRVIGRLVGIATTSSLYILSNSSASVAAVPVMPESFS